MAGDVANLQRAIEGLEVDGGLARRFDQQYAIQRSASPPLTDTVPAAADATNRRQRGLRVAGWRHGLAHRHREVRTRGADDEDAAVGGRA